MWSDNETDRDFLNFSGTADTVAEIIIQAQGKPVSIGVSGHWGVGKSSMIKLIKKTLEEQEVGEEERDYIFVDFNAWLYQGYDDARAALMDVIATILADEAKERETGIDKAKELLGRVNWLRIAKYGVGTAASLALGLPPGGLLGDIYGIYNKVSSGELDQSTLDSAKATGEEIEKTASGLLRPKPEQSPPKEIQAIRNCFEETLEEMGVTLVVLIDDLDRCLPETTISTLEAIRLFLFLNSTAFVIAADDKMIKHAVKRHFNGIDDDLVTNYFDKLIQIPIRVPSLGTQEVRAYMIMLFIENSDLKEDQKETVRQAVCEQLSKSWQGKRVDRAFMSTIDITFSTQLSAQFDTAERLAHIMTTSSKIAGNPRLIKRFLNALSIRMAISHAHGVGVDEAVLAKMLLFERCGPSKAYSELGKGVNDDSDGKPRILSEWEEKTQSGKEFELVEPWEDDFVREWLSIPPLLADLDLRGALYVSREHAPIITPEDRLSSNAADILTGLLSQPDMAESLKVRLKDLPKPELSILMDRILDKARQEQEWGTPSILEACLTLARLDQAQSSKLAGFIASLPQSQIKASIVPKLSEFDWSKDIFDKWYESSVSGPVKGAITQARKKSGNIPVK